MYTEPQATALLEGNIFVYLHRKGQRVNIQNRGYGITGNYCVFNYQYQKDNKLPNANSFSAKQL